MHSLVEAFHCLPTAEGNDRIGFPTLAIDRLLSSTRKKNASRVGNELDIKEKTQCLKR